MSQLQTMRDRVAVFLEEDPECRANDNLLFLKVLQSCGAAKGINLDAISARQLLGLLATYQLPQVESIRRARQYVQEHNPHLKPPEGVRQARKNKEAEYFAFVTGGA